MLTRNLFRLSFSLWVCAFALVPTSAASGLLREVYLDLPGSSISDLINSAKFPDFPDSTNLIQEFETPSNILEEYGQRVRGFVIPPTTGNYIFWISSDDNSALYLSSNEDPANKVEIASVPAWTASREWTLYPEQQSALIPLQAGRIYYIEALMKEGGGDDNLAVRWQLPDGTIEEPIPEIRLLPWGISFGPPIITAQPSDLTVLEGQPAVFTVGITNLDPVAYQWQRSGTNIPGANSQSYMILFSTLADNGARFRARLTNALGGALTSEATLTVVPDTIPLTVSFVQNLGRNTLSIFFSERVEASTATNSANYVIDHGIRVTAAHLEPDTRTVTLDTSELSFGTTYVLTINNVRDRAASPNTIAANTQISFLAVQFAPKDIGNPPPGLSTPVPDGLDVVGGGRGVSTNADQIHFSYEKRTGDFDVQVRVQSLEPADVWASAGLMARESLRTNSPFASILATPSISGIFFTSRESTNSSFRAGTFPVNYPFTWLRLKRVGNLFTGYASLDGQTWTQVGAATNPLPATVLFGMAVSSHNPTSVTRAEFRDLRDVIDGVTGGLPIDFEPLGPSSRRTGLIISEIMFHPAARADGKNLEFIEMFNTQPFPEDISGFRLSGATDYIFPSGTVMPPGNFLVIAKDPVALQSIRGISNVLGVYTNDLSNSAGTIRLLDNLGGVLLEAEYGTEQPWPPVADGAGHSLVLSRPSYGERNVAAWRASQLKDGSPGTFDSIRPEPLRGVVINELLTNTDEPTVDFLELYNHSNAAVDLSGAVLTDDPATNRFVIPPGTIISPRGFLSLTQIDLGFALSSTGETVYFINPNLVRVIDAVRFGAQATGISIGRFSDGSPDTQELQTPTPGAANSGLLIRDIVINEIMYHPLADDPDGEYIELYNQGPNVVDVGNWRFVAGIDFAFPLNTTIPSLGFKVVAKNAARLMTNHPGLNAGNTIGDFQGNLSNSGEQIALARPLDPLHPNQDFVLVDEVTFGEGGRWGSWSDGGGSSLELIDSRNDNRRPSNWADSDETDKSEWMTVESTGVLDLGNSAFEIDNLQIMLMGAGECLIDNVEVIGPNGANLVANSTFEAGDNGWIMRGTHVKSSLENGRGFSSGRSLHIRASARGDTSSNQIKTSLINPLAPGSFATIRAKVRWLRGNPEILLRLHGNYLEAAGRMTVPAGLGTPGSANGTSVPNAGPAIFAVQHAPVLPALNQPVVVTARVDDPDGVAAIYLKYRIDPAPNLTTMTMLDDGTGGDAVAGDGLYSATVPGQATNVLVAFHIQAFDNDSPRVSSTFPSDAPRHECLVRWGETQSPGNFGTYRIWFTQATFNEWANRPPSSNDPLDATFVYGNHRAVYNIGTLYSGSPFHWTGYDTPTGRNANYLLIFPPDDLFLGTTDFVLNLPSNLNSDRTAIREQTFYWLLKELDHPYTYRRFINFFINGVLRGPIFEDAQQPNSDVVQEWFPQDPNGDLYKIEDWFEYNESASSFSNVDATLDNFTGADGEKKLARYRWTWRKRAVRGSAHDYSNLFALADALNAPNPALYTEQVEGLVDVEEWMRTFAFRHLVGDWDAYGYARGKNMYAYKPENGKWQLLDWDIAFAFGLGHGTTHNIFDATHFDGSIDAVTTRMYSHPPFRRAYLRALQEAVNGPFQTTNAGPVIDAKYEALIANAIPVQRPNSVKTWIYNRRTNILQVLAANSAPFAITSNRGESFSISGENLLMLAGTAPVEVKTLRANGVAYPVTWASVTDWNMRIPLRPGQNQLFIQGFDSRNQSLPSALRVIRVDFAGADARPEDHLVINEIMYNPAAPDAGYVEIHNTSSTHAFDLSGYRLSGADFAFAEGTLIGPGGFLVLVNDRVAFMSAYGLNISIAGQFQGRLDNGGETLTLLKPGLPDSQDRVVSQVTFDDDAPWPGSADGIGASLQLLDPSQDGRRVGNWAAMAADPNAESGWKLASVTGTAGSGSLYLYLGSSGEVFLDDVSLVAGGIVGRGANLVKNGDFESSLGGSWIISEIDPDTGVSTAIQHNGTSSLHLVSSSGGNVFLPSIAQENLPVQQGQTYTLSFWYHPSTSGGGLNVGLFGSDIQTTVSLVPGVLLPSPFSPGAENSVRASLTLPQLWINEMLPNNAAGMTDQAGEHEPWIELFNSGNTAVDLSDLYLTDNFTNLLSWAFPPNTILQPGGFLVVWADGEVGESSSSELHTSFRLNPVSGSIALVKKTDLQPLVLDYVNYQQIPADRSFGAFPDGNPSARQLFQFPTPGRANNNASAPVTVFINEWMASNRSTIADPADGDFDDWFELYNPNANPIDLSGYSLSDDRTGLQKWQIPLGTTIPPQGYLVVWADNETGQNNGSGGLHAGFRLDQSGDNIVLFAPNGAVVDSVSFGSQTSDVSEGRFPDGHSVPYVSMRLPTPGSVNIAQGPSDAITGLGVSVIGGSVRISWDTKPGNTYQVQSKDDLSDPAWQNIGTEVTAAGATSSFTDDSPAPNSRRYYQVVLVR